jgi:biopolymer transport protein ExbB
VKDVFSGGFFSMAALTVLLTVLLTYVLERSLFLHSGKMGVQQFVDGVMALLKKNRHNEALTVCESSPGVAALMVKTALALRNKPKEEATLAIANVVLLEIPLLERRLNSIRLIAKVAPMVSFVGTLHILSRTLVGLATGATYLSAAVAMASLQRAVTVVAFGLTINILGTLAYAFLYGRVRRIVHDMEWSYNEIVRYLSTAGGEDDA